MAITGGIYLFKPQIETWMYKDFYYVAAGQTTVPVSAQIESVKKAYPQADITRYRPSDEVTRTAEVGIVDRDVSKTVYVNPYDGKVVGDMEDQRKLMQIMKKLHGELMAGKIGDRMIELSACWGMILLVTGVYLWWPRDTKSLYGTLLPRFTQGKRIFWRDLHAVPAFWLSLFTAILIMTGLPWSGYGEITSIKRLRPHNRAIRISSGIASLSPSSRPSLWQKCLGLLKICPFQSLIKKAVPYPFPSNK